jgi:adenylate cyclase class IV
MPQNLELKARIVSLPEAIRAARSLRPRSEEILYQRDLYYKIPQGRFKLRIFKNCSGELIYYNRQNKKWSRYSNYSIIPVSDAAMAEAFCSAVFGHGVAVNKKRLIFLYKNARIHLDVVRELGTFLVFEIRVNHGKRQAQALLKFLALHFKIKPSMTISGSYIDLLLRTKDLSRKRKIGRF